MKHTVEDFWRMIWENDVAVVVMLANVIEAGKVTGKVKRRLCKPFFKKNFSIPKQSKMTGKSLSILAKGKRRSRRMGRFFGHFARYRGQERKYHTKN